MIIINMVARMRRKHSRGVPFDTETKQEALRNLLVLRRKGYEYMRLKGFISYWRYCNSYKVLHKVVCSTINKLGASLIILNLNHVHKDELDTCLVLDEVDLSEAIAYDPTTSGIFGRVALDPVRQTPSSSEKTMVSQALVFMLRSLKLPYESINKTNKKNDTKACVCGSAYGSLKQKITYLNTATCHNCCWFLKPQ